MSHAEAREDSPYRPLTAICVPGRKGKEGIVGERTEEGKERGKKERKGKERRIRTPCGAVYPEEYREER